MRILFVALFLAGPAVFATEQRPSLTVKKGECHIVDAKQLLDKSQYKAESKYVFSTIEKEPLTLLESVNLDKDNTLKIEQRGCEDIYFKFSFESIAKKPLDSTRRLKEALIALKNLKLSKDAILNKKQINEIVDKIEAALQQLKNGELTVCLSKGSRECFTDVKITTNTNKIEIFYVDRP